MKSILQTFTQLNRNVRILGSAAILILGGLGAWLAMRPARDAVTVGETSVRQTLRNEYFTKLVASGADGFSGSAGSCEEDGRGGT